MKIGVSTITGTTFTLKKDFESVKEAAVYINTCYSFANNTNNLCLLECMHNRYICADKIVYIYELKSNYPIGYTDIKYKDEKLL